jgi:transposase-like protein
MADLTEQSELANPLPWEEFQQMCWKGFLAYMRTVIPEQQGSTIPIEKMWTPTPAPVEEPEVEVETEQPTEEEIDAEINEKYTKHRKEIVIASLLSGMTVKATAVKVGVHYATLRKWLTLPEFKTALRTAKREVMEQASRLAQDKAAKAVQALVAVIESPVVSPSDRIRASESLLEMAYSTGQIEDIKEELEELRNINAQKRSKQTKRVIRANQG